MPLITEIPVQKGETFATVYNDTVGTSFVEYTFSSVQNTLFIHNKGSRNIRVEVGGKQQQVDTGGTLRITEDTDRFKIRSMIGTQPFQVEGRVNIDSSSGIDAGARADISTLATQLEETTVQLADTSQEITKKSKLISYDMNRELISKRLRKPMISFVDDDCRSEITAKWEQTLIDKQIPLNLAVITGSVGNSGFATWEQIDHLRSLGAVTASHTHTHPELATLTAQEVDIELATSKEILLDKGWECDYIVYPYGSDNPTTRKEARKYYKGGVDIEGELNVPPLDTFRVQRFELKSRTLAEYKAQVDNAITNNGWLIFMTHSQYPEFDATQQQHVRDIVDYSRANNVEVVSLKDGYEAIGNILDIGDYYDRAAGTSYTMLDADGVWHSNVNNLYHKRLANNFALFDTPITAFEKDKISYSLLLSGFGTGFPVTTGGIVYTRRDYSNDLYSYQQFYPYNSNVTYKRTWNTTSSSWNAFESAADSMSVHNVVSTVNAYSSTTPITGFPDNKITTFAVNSGGVTGFPVDSAGIVTTYRVYSANWNRQEFKTYQTNQTWVRYYTTSWSEWALVTPYSSTTAARLKQATLGLSAYDTDLNKPIWCKTVGAKEVDTLTITNGATASGNITISLTSATKTIAVVAGDSATTVASKIRAAVYPYWVVSGSADTVIFTRNLQGTSGVRTFTDTDLTGVSGTFSVTTAGTNSIWVDATGTVV